MPYFLVPLADGRSFPLDKAIFFIGRHPECDVVLTHSKKVSRKHCCLAHVDDRFVIRDLGSMNGVRINGKRVRKMAVLNPGDEVAIGDVHYRFQDGGPIAHAYAESPPSEELELNRQPQKDKGVRQKLPLNLSQDVPVPILDEDGSFAVEPSSMLETPEQFPKLSEAPKAQADSDDDLLILDEHEAYEESGSHVEHRPD